MSWLGPLPAAALHIASLGADERANAPVPPAPRPGEAAPAQRLGDHLVRGQATFGWRFVGVSGRRAQFDEDLGLQTGALIRDIDLEGEREADGSGPRSWGLDSHGLGDPASTASARLEGDEVSVLARYRRTHFTGTSESDVHDFDNLREDASLRVEHPARTGDELHGGLEFAWSHTDSFSMLSRSVDFGYVSPVPTRIEERTLGLRGDLGFELGGWTLAVDGGSEWSRGADRRDFALPSPSDPTTRQTEDFAADLEGTGLEDGLRASHALTDRLELELGARAATSHHDGNPSIQESGVLFAPGDDFTRDTQGKGDFHSSEYAFDLALRYEASDVLDLYTRAWSVDGGEHAHLDRHILQVEMGEPSEIDLADRSYFDRQLHLIEAGGELALGETAELSACARAGREHIDLLETVDGVVSRQFDGDLDRYGADATLSARPSGELTWSLGGGWGVDPAHSSFEGTGFAYDDDVGGHAEASVRWRPARGPAWTARLSHRQLESRALETASTVDSAGLDVSGAPAEAWTARGGLALRRLALEADTTELMGFEQVPVMLHHDVLQVLASGALAWTCSESFQPSLALSAAVSSGDVDFVTSSARLDLPLKVTARTDLGLDLESWRVDAPSSVDLASYEALAAFVHLRTSI